MPSTALADNLFQDRVLYTWNSAAMRYQGEGGRFVSHNTIRDAVRQVIEGVSQELGASTLAMMAGDMNIVEWEGQMASTIRTVHAIGAAVNAGGWGQLTPQDMSYVETVITQQLDLLSQFAVQIETGAQALTMQVVQRAEMYKNAGETKQKEIGVEHAQSAGLDYYRNVLGPAEHCDGCLEASAIGWAPIGTLVPIGERDCRTNCKCTWEYGNADDAKALDITPLTSTAVVPNTPFTGAPTAPTTAPRVPIANVNVSVPSAAPGNVIASGPLRASSQPSSAVQFQDSMIGVVDTIGREMTPDERTALSRYKALQYEAVNNTLRKDKTSTDAIQFSIDNLDKTIARSDTQSDVITYRGLIFPTNKPLPGGFADVKAGDVLTDKAFMSTTLTERKVNAILGATNPRYDTVINMRIAVPQGTKALLVDPLVSGLPEDELLLPRNTSVLVRGVTRTDTGLTIDAEVVSNVQAAGADSDAFARATRLPPIEPVVVPPSNFIWDVTRQEWVPPTLPVPSPPPPSMPARSLEIIDQMNKIYDDSTAMQAVLQAQRDTLWAERRKIEQEYQRLLSNPNDPMHAMERADKYLAKHQKDFDAAMESDRDLREFTENLRSDLHEAMVAPTTARLDWDFTNQRGVPGDVEVRVDSGVTWMARILGGDNAMNGAVLPVNYSAGQDRAYYSSGYGITLGRNTPTSTVVHEMGHWLEDKVSVELQDMRKRMVKERTYGEQLQRLDDVFPGAGYRQNEMTYVDQWINAYAGKVYPDDSASEVVSMGFQHLYEDPARLMREDRELYLLLMRYIGATR